jgi:hypothetical protein
MVDFTVDKDAVYPFYPTVKYSDRVEMERVELETKQVKDLDAWEDNLKSANTPADNENQKKDGKAKNLAAATAGKKPAPAPKKK